MWRTYFKFVKLKPGRVVTTLFGEIDFNADNISIETIRALYENGFPYLEITPQGQAALYDSTPEKTEATQIRKPRNGKKAKAFE